MRPFIELFIDRQKIYFSEPPEIFFTFSHSELHNPTVVKNNFSKTLTIEGTPENNKVFGCFGNMDRITAYKDGEFSGAYFNPSRKIDFVLLRNSQPVERGYVKLDKVVKTGKKLKYEITLYGGLGQFLYNLKYREDGTEMKLSDLDYGIDINMNVDKTVVGDAWDRINGINSDGGTSILSEEESIYDFLNFCPCYNGIPEDFTADKVAIDVESMRLNAPDLYNRFVTSKDGYTTVNGWLLAELEKEYDEWQTKDLRSYLQRPVVRFKRIIEACCDSVNNGGYQVNLDDTFFTSSNPYYENAWMTLPLLTETEGINDIESSEYSFAVEGDKYVLSGLQSGQNISITIPVAVGANVSSAELSLRTDRRWWIDTGDSDSALMEYSTNFTRYVQLVAYNSSNEPVAASPVMSFFSLGWDNDFTYEPVFNTSVSRVTGTYKRQNDGTYRFNDKAYDFTIPNLEYEEGMYFKVVADFAYDCGGHAGYPSSTILYDAEGNEYSVSSYFDDLYLDNALVEYHKGRGWYVNNRILLNSEHTPCDYFLEYLKMFNLHIWADDTDKIIYVRTRQNFFTGEQKDIDDFVDRGSEMSITPLTFENKWLNFINEYPTDGILSKTYQNNYGIPYGIQKVDTNYNFDNSSINLFEPNTFQGGIMNRSKSRYFVDIITDDAILPPYCLDGFKTFLFNTQGDTTEGTVFTPKTSEEAVYWFDKKLYDITPKLDFRSKDGKAVDGANVLVFYDGKSELKDTNGTRISIGLSDDIPEFETLNEGEPCWIWSMDWDVSDTTQFFLPIFSRYLTNDNGWVEKSWDFGTPKELYIPDYNIDSSSSIYEQYWADYMRDRYDVNTRVVNCRCYLRERVVGDWLQRLYWWDNSYWVLNTIEDYNPTSDDCTKCEFVKVQDKSVYGG